MSQQRALCAMLIAAILAACSGGGAGAPVATGPQTAPQHVKIGHIKATLHVPAKKHQSAREMAYLRAQQSRHFRGKRKPHYLSGATTELDFLLNTQNGSPATPAEQSAYNFTIYTSSSADCTGNNIDGYTCTITAPAPAGTDTYNVQASQCSVAGTAPGTTCASLGGTLTLLSASYVTVSVVFDQTVTAAFTLNPVVASIDWAPVTYANVTPTTALPNNLWLSQPNGSNIPAYDAVANAYSCTFDAGAGSGNGCFEPVALGTEIAYGDVIEARDSNGALIVGASGGGAIYQTPLYLDANGNAITIAWSCTDNAGGKSLVLEAGGGPYSNSGRLKQGAANEAFNSPVVNPANDADGGNTFDANGNPVTAVGNDGAEINWDGADTPVLASPDYCSASSSNGLTTALDFYAGLGSGGIVIGTPTPSPAPSTTPTTGPTPSPSPTPVPGGSFMKAFPLPQSGQTTWIAPSDAAGNVWFVQIVSGSSMIGKLDSSTGNVTYYTPAHAQTITSLARGSDGALYYLWNQGATTGVDRMDDGGNVTQFPYDPNDGGHAFLKLIFANQQGQMWVDGTSDSGGIGATVSTNGTYDPFFQGGYEPGFATVTPDGSMWTAGIHSGSNAYYAMHYTSGGSISLIAAPTGGNVALGNGAAVGPNGDPWFNLTTGAGGDEFFDINPTTSSYTTYAANSQGLATPWQMHVGGDGNLWYTLNTIVCGFALATTSSTCYAPPVSMDPYAIAETDDGNLWVTDTLGGYILEIEPALNPNARRHMRRVRHS